MRLDQFLGIHNTNPPRSIPDASLVDACNVDLTDSGAVVRRAGSALALSVPVSASYSCEAGAFIVSDGVLYRITPDLTLTPLADSRASAFTDHGGIVFTNDGFMVNGALVTDLKALHQTHAYPTLHDADPMALPDKVDDNPLARFADPYPIHAEVLAWHNSALWCAQSMDSHTVIWHSKPFHYHLFDYEANYIMVPGRVLAMRSINGALIIGTTDAVYRYANALDQVADYGVIPGQPFAEAPERVPLGENMGGSWLVFTQRGVCHAEPFANLTERKVKAVHARRCAATVEERNGRVQFIAAYG